MPLTRSSGSQRPCINVVVGVTFTKKGELETFETDKNTAPKRRDSISVENISKKSNIASTSRRSLTLRAPRNSRSSYSGTASVCSDWTPEKYTLDALQLLRHPDVLAIEPYRLLCRKCSEWVPTTTMFHFATFNIHIKHICEKRGPREKQVEKMYDLILKIPRPPYAHFFKLPRRISLHDNRDSSHISDDNDDDDDDDYADTDFETGPSQSGEYNAGWKVSHWSKHRTEAERAQFLRDDPRSGDVEPRRIFCRLCGLWIKLRNTTTYCLTPWLVHVGRCSKRTMLNTSEPPDSMGPLDLQSSSFKTSTSPASGK